MASRGSGGRELPVGGGRLMRRFTIAIADPLVRRLRLAGGRRSPLGLLSVRGSRTGRVRTVPVLAHVADGFVLIPMSFGEDVAWVRNVQAAGSASLRHANRSFELAEPELVDLDVAAPLLPTNLPAQYERLRIRRLLRFRVAADA